MTEQTLYSTKQVEDLIGISHRRLDHLIRSGVLEKGPGIGYKRTWTEDTIRRLSVAKSLDISLPPLGHQGMSMWPVLATITMRGPIPIPGWVQLGDDGEIQYWGLDGPATLHSGLWAYWPGVRRLDGT